MKTFLRIIILLSAVTASWARPNQEKKAFDTLDYLLTGSLKLEAKKYVEAKTDFTKAIRRDKGNWRAYRLRADAEDGLDDYKASIKDYTTALQLNPNDTLSYRGRGEAKRRSKDFMGAIVDYDVALALNPEDVFTRFGRALSNYEIGLYPEAIDDLSIFLRQPESINKKIFFPALVERAYSSLMNHDFVGALDDFKTAFKLGYRDTSVYIGMGRAFYYLRNRSPLYLDSAIASYRIGSKANVNIFEEYYYLGEAYYEKGDYKISEEYLAKALAVNSNHARALLLFIGDKIGQRKFVEADNLFPRYLQLKKELTIGMEYLFLGIAKWGAKQDTVGAVHDFDMAAKLGGIDKGIFDNQFLLLFGNKRYAAKVKGYITEEISRTSDNVRQGYLLASRSLVDVQLKSNREALADITKALEIAPESPIVYIVKGALSSSLSLTDEAALEIYDKAILLDNQQPAAYLIKAYYYRKHGELGKSCENLSAAEQRGATPTATMKDYLCNGVDLWTSRDSEFNAVVYPALRRLLVD